MWFGPALSVAIFALLTVYAPLTLVFALPFLILWTIAPFITWLISRPYTLKAENISEAESANLRILARKIWFFFETFVTRQDNWLPPDNYQEAPVERVAHRTCLPTWPLPVVLFNRKTTLVSLYRRNTERSSNTLNSMQQMERFRDTLQWYDTESLSPRIHAYFTVDSGNLAGHLITMQQGCCPGR